VIRRIGVITLLWCTAFSPSRAEDAALSSVHQTLSRLEIGARNTFFEDSDERPSPTPKHHRKSEGEHTAAKRKAHKHSGVETPASSPGSDDSNEGRESKSGSKTSTKSKRERARSNDDDAETPRPTPSPTPVREGVAGPESEVNSGTAAPMATIKPEALDAFSRQPAEVQQLIRSSLALTQQNLNYKYGSADPSAGGMDCSGFIYYVLNNAGYKDVPRDSAGQYAWVRKSGNFRAVLSRSFQSFEFDELKPGDLLFWSGTYDVDRDIPITHVMIYLGKEKSTGKPVMVGSTDGRSYDGVRRYGVSVFDFKMPSGKSNADDPALTARFEGYASIPGLRGASAADSGTFPQK
jgi:cell wall-associated NlpC family hydrolase